MHSAMTLLCEVRGNGNVAKYQQQLRRHLSDIKLKENIVDANSQWD
jgi:hypothetical protein